MAFLSLGFKIMGTPSLTLKSTGKATVKLQNLQRTSPPSASPCDMAFFPFAKSTNYLFMYFITRSSFSKSFSSIRSVQYFTTCKMSSSIGSKEREKPQMRTSPSVCSTTQTSYEGSFHSQPQRLSVGWF